MVIPQFIRDGFRQYKIRIAEMPHGTVHISSDPEQFLINGQLLEMAVIEKQFGIFRDRMGNTEPGTERPL